MAEDRIMYRLPVTILLLLAVAGCASKVEYTGEVKEALHRLDMTIAAKDSYEAQKESHIRSIKSRISGTSSTGDYYDILDMLYQEYYQYNIDSAIFYARAKLDTVQKAGDRRLANDAILDLSDRYIMSGMYAEAIELMDGIVYDLLDWPEIPRYLHIYHALYDGMGLVCDDPVLRRKYRRLSQEYRQKLYERLGEEDTARLLVHSEMLCDSGKAEEALVELLDRVNSKECSVHEKAMLSYSIARAYRKCADNDKAMLWYARSAVNDICTPVHEYRSLYELAILLYDAGDVKRAYRYIVLSVNDALSTNARVNIQSINEFLPIIFKAYEQQMKIGKDRLVITIAAISLLLVLLLAISCIIIIDRRRIASAELETRKANEELKKLNIELKKYVDSLQEANDIKETYLGRYIDLCSDYIGRLDKYRLHLNKTAKTEGMEEVRKELRATSFIEEELEEFYAQFDATFLKLFPDFVEKLNLLLQPEKRIKVKQSSNSAILTTELRIFALIRLGVHDSVKIAVFLRRSVSTVYNYRVKMRNSAMNSREDLEKQIMKIGIY